MSIFAKLAWIFFKIGLLTVGGGLAMIPIIQYEMVRLGWLDNQQFLDILGIAQMTPGAISVNTATFVGYRIGGIAQPGSFWMALAGALIGSVAVCAPSLICVNAFGAFWQRNQGHPWISNVFAVLRPLVTGLVITAAALLVLEALWGGQASDIMTRPRAPDILPAALVLSAFVLTAFTRLSPVYVLLGGAVVGLLVGL
ncbi:MAG: chromate transporter [Kiritimatiellae bacterium]|nr:chromate transporter [Kiritimatiellia bacterium]MDD4025575.1 chromate transporter [Kiritimatiellia bacterium]